MPRIIDKNCPACQGSGYLMTSECVDAAQEYRCHFSDCYCVQIKLSDEEKAWGAKALADFASR